MVEIEGLKPSTSSLPAMRSNQLSYIPATRQSKLSACEDEQLMMITCSLLQLFAAPPPKITFSRWRSLDCDFVSKPCGLP